MNIVQSEVDYILTACKCGDPDCEFNYQICKTPMDILAKISGLYQEAANQRSIMFQDLTLSMYDSSLRLKTKKNMAANGTVWTLRLAALEVVVLAVMATEQRYDATTYLHTLKLKAREILNGKDFRVTKVVLQEKAPTSKELN